MRLIDADAFISYCGLGDTEEKREINYEDNIGEIVSLEDFERQPTIEAAPVVHAHWEGGGTEIRCSHCKEYFGKYVNPTEDWSLPEYPKVCPDCGAKMDMDEG